jgi:HEPN domain-containing protein
MNVPLERLELVRLWIEKAESDYRNFQNTLKMGDDCPYDTVCFHAQQCVEKYLKARLVYLSIDFSKTHDIGDVVQLLPPGTHIPLIPSEQEQLTNYAWKGRYPGNWTPINRKQAEEAAALAVKVRTAIRAGFPKGVLSQKPGNEPGVQEPRAVYSPALRLDAKSRKPKAKSRPRRRK